MIVNKKELLARAELGTYLQGLADASRMTKAELREAIKTIENSDE